MLDEGDLVPGLEILLHSADRSVTPYRVIEAPLGGRVLLRHHFRIGAHVAGPHSHFLFDMGMRPYGVGAWNPTNYATRAGRCAHSGCWCGHPLTP